MTGASGQPASNNNNNVILISRIRQIHTSLRALRQQCYPPFGEGAATCLMAGFSASAFFWSWVGLVAEAPPFA